MKSSGISLYFKLVRNIRDVNQQGTLIYINIILILNCQLITIITIIIFTVTQKEDEYLINLIDSPGHVDFSSEVSTASRLCDGGLVLVDVVEGVCTQTHTVLRQAWKENVRPILVLNKIDRIITELKLSPLEAFWHMNRILEQVNAIMGTFYTEELLAKDAAKHEERKKKLMEQEKGKAETKQSPVDESSDWHVEFEDDSHLYFSPERGNVIFASAIDGWAFRVHQFASLYAAKLGFKEENLRKVLWGEYYLDPKTKRVLGAKHLKGRPLKPLFVQFILDNIWAVYDAVLINSDRERIEKIVKTLQLKVLPRDLRSKDGKSLIQTIFSQWLPLSFSVLVATIEQLPSPITAQGPKLARILHPNILNSISDPTPEPKNELERALYSCNPNDPEAPVVVYVSKMFSVPKNMLPGKKKAPLSTDQLREKRQEYLRKQQQFRANAGEGITNVEELEKNMNAISLSEATSSPIIPTKVDESELISQVTEDESDEVLIGFARIYSGTIRPGQKLYVLGPKYDPAFPDLHRTETTVDRLFLLMGRDLEDLDEVPAGNVFGIGGLDQHVLKSATLSSVIDCPSFGQVQLHSAPIVRVALEPEDPTQMSALLEGLKLLNQADPCVEVFVQETGEHVIVCAGELHLERCLKDLRERFAKIAIQASAPIVPFRETIAPTPAIQVNTATSSTSNNAENSHADKEKEKEKESLPTGTVIMTTPNKLVTLRVRAVPIPLAVSTFLTTHSETIQQLVDATTQESDVASWGKTLESFSNKLKILFHEAGNYGVVDSAIWDNVMEKIWAFGPKRCGSNLLINSVKGYERGPWTNSSNRKTSNRKVAKETDVFSEEEELIAEAEAADVVSTTSITNTASPIRHYEGSIFAGFQLATASGPLCAEPMAGVAFFVEDFTINQDEENPEGTKDALKAVSGQIISTMREACRQAFLTWSPRLMLAVYTCSIQAASEVLGKVYAVVSKRRGRILSEEMKEGTPFFDIVSMMPVVESFGFSDEIRKRTSGAAQPQLIFSGFEVLDIDPFWVPNTEEELEDLGDKADRDNLAKKYMEGVRRRKGMFIERKIVEHAEKQKTLKNK